MKKYLVMILLSVFTLISCSTYYQVYSVAPNDDMEIFEDFVVFENDDCRILYDLWEEGGNASYIFLNKTDKNIYIHLDESFFVLNDFANEYFQNREFSIKSDKSITSGIARNMSVQTSGFYNSNLLQSNQLSTTVSKYSNTHIGQETTYIEKKVICIPPSAYKIINGYKINEEYLDYCDLEKYPKSRANESLIFNDSATPILFENIISYSINSKEGERKAISNKFFVDEIANHSSKKIIQMFDEYRCDKKIDKVEYNIMIAPYRFYIKYGINE